MSLYFSIVTSICHQYITIIVALSHDVPTIGGITGEIEKSLLDITAQGTHGGHQQEETKQGKTARNRQQLGHGPMIQWAKGGYNLGKNTSFSETQKRI